MRNVCVGLALVAVSGCAGGGDCGQTWAQWAEGATHRSYACSRGQLPLALLDDVVIDPFVAQEVAEADGDLIIHYPSPLVVDHDLYMEIKGGSYLSCSPPQSGTPAGCGPPWTWASETWNETHFTIANDGKLARDWSFASDWKPMPLAGFEPL